MIFRRDTMEKQAYPIDGIKETIENLLKDINKNLLEKARKLRDEKTYYIDGMDDFKKKVEETPGFYKAMWCGDRECEEHVKAETGATIRCIPFEQENLGDTCHFCGKPAKHMVYVAKAY